MVLRRSHLLALALLTGPLSVACSSNNNDKTPDGVEGTDGGDTTGPTGNDLFTPGAADRCKKVPNTPYLNNDLCLEPPSEDLGFQLHFGPSDYDDPAEVEKYILPAGGEGVLCESAVTPNMEDQYSQEQHTRIRSGTHHIIYWRNVDDKVPEVPPRTLLKDNCRQSGYAFFIGAEAALGPKGGFLDVPLAGATSAYGEEDKSIAQIIHPKTKIWIETHFVNQTEDDMLREAWANVIYTDGSKITTILDPIFWIGGLAMQVPAHTEQLIYAGPATPPTFTAGKEVRLMGIAGHIHAHTTQEDVYLNHADGTKELVYQTFNWAEPLFAQFDDQHQNPAMGRSAGADGSISGKFIIKPGESVSWACHVNNTLNTVITFADRAFDAEMCNVFGYYIPGNGGNWAAASTARLTP